MAFVILVCTASASFGAESANQDKLVSIGVFDDVTRSPVAGVKVSVAYYQSRTVGDEGVTDEKGMALLKAR